ncbi:MAG: sigma 54-interacting transcriptional regulator [Gemmatimonadaceae bacterium]
MTATPPMLRHAFDGLRPDEHGIERLLIGSAPAMRELRSIISRVARTSLPVLIEGPTGSGKELVARAIHAASGRRGAFVAFNVAAVGETLFEDALFGHVKGAFTGATTSVPGYLVEANQGTCFFDEIGALPHALQPKLLRAIESGCFRPVGARVDSSSNFRLVAATNEPIARLVRHGRFREDLAFRLGGVVIVVPPLRDRVEDIPILADYFAERVGHSREAGAMLSAEAKHALQERDWPGNVRELKHMVERVIALADGPVISAADVRAQSGARSSSAADVADDEPRRQRLREVLVSVDWDTGRAATVLGVDRTTVYRRMNRLGITPPRMVRD